MSALPTSAPTRLPEPQLPDQIGKYRVLSKLGEGATSEVFLARDEFRNQNVAIKRVRTGLLADSRENHFQQHFFAAEAALVGRLQHPNVVRIFDAVFDAPAPYLVMEYVPGPTLRRFCRADALLPLEQVVEIGFKCAMALDYMFRQGLIHRDVKPANILAVLDGEQVVDVKITDFGSVFAIDAERTQVYRVGSLAYMSPEQLDGDTVDSRADIYSLAAVLYHLIAGRPPFDAVQQPAIMNQIFTATPPPLASLREGVSPRLEALVMSALAKKRDDRPTTWDVFARGLSAMLDRPEVPVPLRIAAAAIRTRFSTRSDWTALEAQVGSIRSQHTRAAIALGLGNRPAAERRPLLRQWAARDPLIALVAAALEPSPAAGEAGA